MAEDTEQEIAARRKMTEAMADYYEGSRDEPGIVTGYVVVYEVTRPGGIPTVYWMSGTGAQPTEDDAAGLPRHRGIGMLHYALEQWLP